MPNNGGGATGVSRQMLLELARQGIRVDCYFPGDAARLPEVLVKQPGLRFFCQPSSWQWNRWYSRNNYLAFVTGQLANLRCEMKLADMLVEHHRQEPYDLVYQFSHIELHALRKYKRHLPPIILHPSVHAAGELRWHRIESALAKESESWLMRAGVRLLLIARSAIQRRHIRDADYVLSISRNFAEELIRDYNVQPHKVTHIVPNPIDTERFAPDGARTGRFGRKLTFLFVSRIAVRKGVEMIVELSHRLDDLSDELKILVVGNKSLWSNYTGLLRHLNPRVAEHIGQVSGQQMREIYRSVDALIQPSHYEPFGLTVGEALACGIPVIASDKVGAAENVDPLCCRVFPVRDMDGLEKEVRRLFQDLQSPSLAEEIGRKARSEAVRLYSDSVVVSQLIGYFRQFAQRSLHSGG